MGPILDIHAEEAEHPWHGKWKVGQVGQRRAVFQRDVLLARLRKPFLHDVPLFENIVMQPTNRGSYR